MALNPRQLAQYNQDIADEAHGNFTNERNRALHEKVRVRNEQAVTGLGAMRGLPSTPGWRNFFNNLNVKAERDKMYYGRAGEVDMLGDGPGTGTGFGTWTSQNRQTGHTTNLDAAAGLQRAAGAVAPTRRRR